MALSPDHVLEKLRRLPTPPALIRELMSELHSSHTSIEKIAHTIGKDPALAATMLRLANSSFYGMEGRIASLRQAAIVLGMRTLEAMVIATSMARQFVKPAGLSDDWTRFWRHSFATAICARNFTALAGINSETAFAAGLLHDIGRLVLATCFAAEYQNVVAAKKSGAISLLEAERAVLGTDHAAVGAAVATFWNLPDVLRDPIAYHHQPDPAVIQPLNDVVYAANLVTQDTEGSSVSAAYGLAEAQPVWTRLNLDLRQVEQCASAAAVGAREIAALLLAEI